MSNKKKNIFNDTAKKLRNVGAASLGGVFLLGGSAAPQTTDVFEQPTYWRHKDYDIIAKVERCPDGLCASIAWMNANAPNVKYLQAQVEDRKKRVRVHAGGPGFKYKQVTDWESVTPDTTKKYCGYQAEMKLTPQKDGSWKGTVKHPYKKDTYDIRVRPQGQDELKLSAIILGFEPSVNVQRVKYIPPRCN